MWRLKPVPIDTANFKINPKPYNPNNNIGGTAMLETIGNSILYIDIALLSFFLLLVLVRKGQHIHYLVANRLSSVANFLEPEKPSFHWIELSCQRHKLLVGWNPSLRQLLLSKHVRNFNTCQGRLS